MINNNIINLSVTQRIGKVSQPKNGYLPIYNFKTTQLPDSKFLDYHLENVAPTTMGLLVDYMTRFMETKDVNKAFAIPKQALQQLELMIHFNPTQNDSYYYKKIDDGIKYLNIIKGLDTESINAARKLVGLDVIYRTHQIPDKLMESTDPDQVTTDHLIRMIERSQNFFKEYGPITDEGMTFEGGYTNLISSGDADFMTKDTLWDFKTSISGPTNKYSLQLYIYYQLGLHSIHKEKYKDITKLGIYNPRLNQVYLYNISDIPRYVSESINRDVIGFID